MQTPPPNTSAAPDQGGSSEIYVGWLAWWITFVLSMLVAMAATFALIWTHHLNSGTGTAHMMPVMQTPPAAIAPPRPPVSAPTVAPPVQPPEQVLKQAPEDEPSSKKSGKKKHRSRRSRRSSN